MKLWQLNYRFIQLKFGNFFLSTIFLTISLIVTNYMASQIEQNLRTYKIITELDETSYVFFQQENRINLEGVLESISEEEFELTSHSSYEDLLDDTIKKLNGVFSVNEVIQFTAENKDIPSGYINIIQLSSQLDEALSLPLKKGQWCQNVNGNTIEAVISNESGLYNIGDKISIVFDDKPYFLVITGILESPALEFRMNTAGDKMCSLDFMYNYDEATNDGAPLVYVASSWELSETMQPDDGRIIFFDESISDEKMKENIKILSKEGFTAQTDELHEGTGEQIRISTSKYLPSIIFLILIVIIGLTSSAILNTLEYRKHYAIFFMVGCTWMQCIAINLMYICTSIVISLLIYFVYQVLFASIPVSSINLTITICICIFVILASALVPYQKMKNITPKELITLDNE